MLSKPDFDSFLREYWTTNKMEVNTFQNRPWLAKIPKNTDVGGEYWVVPQDVDDGADGGPDFATALDVASTAGTDSLRRQFQVQFVEDFQMCRISNKLIRLSRKTPELALKKAALESAKKKNILGNRLARNMYKSGYNDIGTIDTSISALSTSVLGIANKLDMRNFRVGLRLQTATTLTAALDSAGAYVTVTKVDFDGQKVTTDAPVNLTTSIPGIANGSTIFLKGGRGVLANPTLLAFQGFAAWNPLVAPTAGDNFNGVDRSIWPDRLAGLRYNNGTAISGPIQEIFIDSIIDACIREAYVDTSFMDPSIYGTALKTLEGTVDRVQNDPGVGTDGKPTKIGFNGFSVQVGYGSNGLKAFPDANCLVKTQCNLTLSTWELGSAGELIQNDLQSGENRDVENASQVEYRYVFCGAMVCTATGKNQVVKYA